MSNTFTGITALREPNFRQSFEGFYEVKKTQLKEIVQVVEGAGGDIYFDLIPAQGVARDYDVVADSLRNTLYDENGNTTQIIFQRRKATTELYGVQHKVASADIPQLKFDVRSHLMRQMTSAVSLSIDNVIIGATGRFVPDLSTNSSNLTASAEFFTQTDTDTNPGSNTTLTDRSATSLDGSAGGANGITAAGVDARDYSGTTATTAAPVAEGVATQKIDRITIAELAAARQRIIARGRLLPTTQVVVFINPISFVGLVRDPDIRNYLSQTSSETVVTGNIKQLAGCRIIQNSILPPGGAVMMTTRAIGLAIRRQIEAGSESRIQEAGALVLAAWINMGAVLLRPQEVEFIHTRTTKFALQRPVNANDRLHNLYYGA